jgi:CheY-like chemotaxis protein
MLTQIVHVLLVDDERLSRVVVSNLLRKCNYKGKEYFPAITSPDCPRPSVE